MSKRDHLKHLGFHTAAAIAASKLMTMNEPTIDQINEAIAVFNGWERYEDKYGIWFKRGDLIKCLHPKLQDLRYHTSWDWLMPVVQKIGNLRVKSSASYNSDLMFRIEIVNGYTEIEGATEKIFFNSSIEGSMLNATYKAVYQFITWYNQQITTNAKGNEKSAGI